jgi:tRNA (cmo5U34)-methyltransferase
VIEQTHQLGSAVWSEQDSEKFIDLGRYFVPDREEQLRIICDLVPPALGSHHVVDLCGGEGFLSKALAERHPRRWVHIFDGSSAMLKRATRLLTPYESRIDVQVFDLAATDWRKFPWPVHAAVSSLAIHHLDDRQKQILFRDVAKTLTPGGAFLIADLVRPTTTLGVGVAAQLWDQAVQKRALVLDGDLKAFEHFKGTHWNMYSDPEPDPIDKPSPLLDQLKWLEDAGLVDVDVFWMNAGHVIFGGFRA